MAAKNKTTYTGVDVKEFISSYVESEQKKIDSFELVGLMTEWTGFEPKMWGPTIIGFGNYSYKYDSGHEGEAPIIGFSPRKAAFSLYVYSPSETSKRLLVDLGKYKMAKSCIYVKKLSDINIPILKNLCMESINYITQHHECGCRENNT